MAMPVATLDIGTIRAIFAAMQEMGVHEISVEFDGADGAVGGIGPIGLPRDAEDSPEALQRLIEQERQVQDRHVGLGAQFPMVAEVKAQTTALLRTDEFGDWTADLGADGFVRWCCPAEGEPSIAVEMCHRFITINREEHRFDTIKLASLKEAE